MISLELINTAIETTVDIAMPEINEKAKYAKDIAAGGDYIGTAECGSEIIRRLA